MNALAVIEKHFFKNEIIIYSINHFNCLTYVLKFNTAMDSKRDL